LHELINYHKIYGCKINTLMNALTCYRINHD